MAKFTMEQVQKWNAGAGEGWRLDLQALAVWNEKVLVFDGEEDEKGEFYRLTLKYREETEGEGWRAKATGRQIPTVDIDRMTPTGTDSGMYRIVLVCSESLADLAKTKKMFSHLQKISKTLDTDEYIKKAIEKDTGKAYNDLSDFENETEEQKTDTQEPETIEESETLTDEEITVSEGMKFIDADNKVFEITKLDNMSIEFNNGERALYDFGTSRTLKAVLDALGNGAKYQNAQTKKDSFTDNLCKTTENGNTENAGTDSIAESTEESKEENYTETYTQTSTGQKIAIEEINGKYYNVYGHDTKEAVKAGGFETIEKAREMLQKHRPGSTKDGEPTPEEKEVVAESATTTEQKEENHSEIKGLYYYTITNENGEIVGAGKVNTNCDNAIKKAREETEEYISDTGISATYCAGGFKTPIAKNAREYLKKKAEEQRKQQKETTATTPTFEELARAFVTGKTVKKQKKAEVKEEPQEQKEEPKEPPKPQKVGYGYEESSDFFTQEEIETLENGGQVKKDGYRKNEFITFFSAPYTLEGARLVYELSTAGHDAHYRGFIVNHKFYNDKEKISAEMKTDINTEVKRLLPTEQDAEKNAGEVPDHEKEQIDFYRNNDFLNDAQRHFYNGTEPELILYHPYNSFGYDECIKYLLNPTEYTQEQAKEYINNYNRVEIVKRYMQFNRTTATLAKIRADKGSETQKMKRIMDSIDKEKSVKVTLANGNTVKVDADAVKRIGYSGYISSYNVSACDRQYLEEKEVRAEDIKQITHGQRILYKVA